MSQIELIQEVLTKLTRLKDDIRREAIDWWWLDQGDAPILEINNVIIEGKRIKETIRIKMSIKVAITKIIENLQQALELPEKERTKLLRLMEENLLNLTETFRRIREAHKIMNDLEVIISRLEKIKGDSEKEKLLKIARGSVNWIREIFYKNPDEWSIKKATFERVLAKLKIDVEKLESL